MPVVGNAQPSNPSALGFNPNSGGTGVETVFDQFFDDTRGPLYHFACGDLVGQTLGKNLNRTHEPGIIRRWPIRMLSLLRLLARRRRSKLMPLVAAILDRLSPFLTL